MSRASRNGSSRILRFRRGAVASSTSTCDCAPRAARGPLATKFSAFAAYQRTTAQTWEHMALTRARPIAGDAALGRRVESEIAAILREGRRPRLATDVVEMRALVEQEKPATTPWDMKLVPGGLLDLEFIAQYLVLRGDLVLRDAAVPEGPPSSTTHEILSIAVPDVLGPDTAAALVAAHRLISTIWHVTRVALPDSMTPDTAGNAFTRRLVKAAGCGSFTTLKRDLSMARQEVRRAFERLLF